MTSHAIEIAAPANIVFDLVSDPIRMGEWSPECVRCRWIGDVRAAEVGARFRGTSRHGWRRWTTTSEITALEPDRLFAWTVTYVGLAVARWSYTIESTPTGVTLTEAVHDDRGRALRALSPFITGSRDRAARNSVTIATTLERVRSAAEALASR